MPRIKLNRPPPVSSEGAREIASDNKDVDVRVVDSHHVPTHRQPGDVSAANVSAGVEKCPNDQRLITRKESVIGEEDVRTAITHRHTVVRDAHKAHDSTASANIVPAFSDALVASESTEKESKKKKRHDDVITLKATGDGDARSNSAQQHIAARTDNTNSGSQNVVFVTQRKRKTSKKSNTARSNSTKLSSSRSAGVESSKCSSHSSSNDIAGLLHSSQETVPPVERQQTALSVDQKQSGSLLDDVLKGFLVQKLAVIENERKGTDVSHKYISVEAVDWKEPKDVPLSAQSKSRKRSRDIDDRLMELSYLPVKITDRDKALHHSDVRYVADRPTHSDRGYMRSRLDNYPHQGHYRLPSHIMHGLTDTENVPKHDFGAEVSRYPHSSPHQGLRHRPPHFVHGPSDAEDITKLHFGSEVSSFRRDHRNHELNALARHSLDAERRLLSSDERNRCMEHRQQSYDLPELKREQFSERKIFDCVEQIRNFVTHSQSFTRDCIPLEVYNESSDPKACGTEKRKSRSSSSHRCHHHHHHKKLKTAKSTLEEKMSRHKCAKHSSGEKGMQKAKTLQEAKLTSKKCTKLKHKHKCHHMKSKLSDVHIDRKKPDMNATLPHVEPKDDDTFNERRSLSPLGVPIKRRKKHTKKKHGKKTVSQISVHDASLLPVPEKSDVQFDKVSCDEEFVPMKVQKNEDVDAVPVNALHKVNEPRSSGVKKVDTKRKYAIGLQNKFLKISGKRLKSRISVSDANQSLDVSVSSEHAQGSDISVKEHPAQTADQFQAVADTAIDHVPTEKTMEPLVAVSQDAASQMDSTRDVSTLASLTASEQANSCIDAAGRKVLQTVTTNADKVSDEAVGEGHTYSPDEVSVASQKSTVAAADGDNVTEASTGDTVLQSEECELVEETNDATKELSTQMDGIFTSKIGSPDNTVTEKELTSYSEEHAASEVSKSELSALETQSDILNDSEPDEVHTKTCAEEQSKDTEKQSEELKATLEEEGENNTTQPSASCDVIALAEHSSKPSTEALATCDMSSREDGSPAETESSAKIVHSHTADEKDDGNQTVAPPSNLMGLPLASASSIAFKKPLPLKMSLRITNTSASFISSGAKKTGKKVQDGENREEGN